MDRHFDLPAPNTLWVAAFTQWESRERTGVVEGVWQGSLRFHRPRSVQGVVEPLAELNFQMQPAVEA